MSEALPSFAFLYRIGQEWKRKALKQTAPFHPKKYCFEKSSQSVPIAFLLVGQSPHLVESPGKYKQEPNHSNFDRKFRNVPKNILRVAPWPCGEVEQIQKPQGRVICTFPLKERKQRR